MHRFRAALLPDAASRGEDAHRERQQVRRAALSVLELDSDALEEAITDVETAESMFWLYEQIKELIAWHDAERALLENASERLLTVLSDRIEALKQTPSR